jgi:hypothetical protein
LPHSSTRQIEGQFWWRAGRITARKIVPASPTPVPLIAARAIGEMGGYAPD